MSGQSRRILPSGSTAPSLMVISDIPDTGDMESGTLLSGDIGRLFDAMMNAIGLDRSKIYLSSLAIARPTGGFINEDEARQLTLRICHQIALVAPTRVLLLGDKTSRALLPTVDGGNIVGLRPLNHEGGTLDAIAISHPRFLLKQPLAKMGSWRQLQLLIGAEPS
ncbi:MAG: uracil-DNA glycosylase family protein [Sphingobium sp.]